MIRVPYKRVEHEGFVIQGSKVIGTLEELVRSYQSRDEIASDLMDLEIEEVKRENTENR